MPQNSDVQPTELLRAWSQGDESARDRLIPLLYSELHRLARRYMRQERPDHTLQATALVNEAYLRLIDVNRVEWRNRTHFLALAAQMMRRILIESGRGRRRQKRGGGAVRVDIDDLGELPGPQECNLVALSDALSALAVFDARMSQVVELRFFGGLSVEETADVLNVSPETVMRDWKTAKAWLFRELRQPKPTCCAPPRAGVAAVIESATERDLPGIRALLERLHLPLAGVGEHLTTMLVAREGDQIVGTAGLELYPDGALLRSVAVEPHKQGKQLGHQLTDAALHLASSHGVNAVFLLTTTAERFFPKFGFEQIDREQVPPSVRESVEFQSACPASAIVMRKQLSAT